MLRLINNIFIDNDLMILYNKNVYLEVDLSVVITILFNLYEAEICRGICSPQNWTDGEPPKRWH